MTKLFTTLMAVLAVTSAAAAQAGPTSLEYDQWLVPQGPTRVPFSAAASGRDTSRTGSRRRRTRRRRHLVDRQHSVQPDQLLRPVGEHLLARHRF